MGWSWRLGKIAGIDVYVHFTFLILLIWVAVSHYLHEGSFSQALGGLLFILSLFLIVVLHELGHALAARRYGIRTRDITLLPIGGVARLERIPEKPRQELVVALAGPLVNIVIAASLYLGLMLREGFASFDETIRVGGSFIQQMFWINIFLAGFNLLPAFPMDGGRALRALLALRMDYVEATQLAARIGQGFALLFGLAGLFMNPFLVFIALFVWMGAAQEASMVQMRAAISGIPIQRAMISRIIQVHPHDTLDQVTKHLLSGFQQDFPVVENHRLVGVLTRNDLIRGLSEQGSQAKVEAVMQKDFKTAEPHEMLENVLARLQNCGCRTLPVVRDGEVIGLVTAENLGELLMIQEATRQSNSRARRLQI